MFPTSERKANLCPASQPRYYLDALNGSPPQLIVMSKLDKLWSSQNIDSQPNHILYWVSSCNSESGDDVNNHSLPSPEISKP